MTQDEIIEMAKQAGLIVNSPYLMPHDHVLRGIEAFEKLVAEAEREACAQVCDAIDKSHWGCEVKASWCSQAIRARGEA